MRIESLTLAALEKPNAGVEVKSWAESILPIQSLEIVMTGRFHYAC